MGYALFEALESEPVAAPQDATRSAEADLTLFSKSAKLVSFRKFQTEAEALVNATKVAEGEVSDELRTFLQSNVRLAKGRSLGIQDAKLASDVQSTMGIACQTNQVVSELCRAARRHLGHLVGGLDAPDVDRANLGLGHAYSRAKIRFNVDRQDNMIIQAIQLLDQMDKDVNTSSMRVREWYGWHFPELAKTVSDPYLYARLVEVLGDRARSCLGSAAQDQEIVAKLDSVTHDNELSRKVLAQAKSSMGMALSAVDMMNITMFAKRVESLAKYRHDLHEYLGGKMGVVAPNLNALLGESLGARLIAHAGSLTRLSKLPASTVQILGAEKALFRALKSKGNTPKFGLLFNSTFISRANAKSKGRISRFLANKCAIASRIDAFSDNEPTSRYGIELRNQVEDRLSFYEGGGPPAKNLDVMLKVKAALQESGEGRNERAVDAPPPSKRKGSKAVAAEQDDNENEAADREKDRKKKKKRDRDTGDDDGTKEERKARKKAARAAADEE